MPNAQTCKIDSKLIWTYFSLTLKDYDEYISSGFLALQRNLDRAFIEVSTEGQSPEFIEVRAKLVVNRTWE